MSYSSHFRKFILLRSYVQKLKEGAVLLRFDSLKSRDECLMQNFFILDSTATFLTWWPNEKTMYSSVNSNGEVRITDYNTVRVSEIEDIQTGQIKRRLQVEDEMSDEDDSTIEQELPYLTLISPVHTIHILFDTWREFEVWFQGLAFLADLTHKIYSRPLPSTMGPGAISADSSEKPETNPTYELDQVEGGEEEEEEEEGEEEEEEDEEAEIQREALKRIEEKTREIEEREILRDLLSQDENMLGMYEELGTPSRRPLPPAPQPRTQSPHKPSASEAQETALANYYTQLYRKLMAERAQGREVGEQRDSPFAGPEQRPRGYWGQYSSSPAQRGVVGSSSPARVEKSFLADSELDAILGSTPQTYGAIAKERGDEAKGKTALPSTTTTTTSKAAQVDFPIDGDAADAYGEDHPLLAGLTRTYLEPEKRKEGGGATVFPPSAPATATGAEQHGGYADLYRLWREEATLERLERRNRPGDHVAFEDEDKDESEVELEEEEEEEEEDVEGEKDHDANDNDGSTNEEDNELSLRSFVDRLNELGSMVATQNGLIDQLVAENKALHAQLSHTQQGKVASAEQMDGHRPPPAQLKLVSHLQQRNPPSLSASPALGASAYSSQPHSQTHPSSALAGPRKSSQDYDRAAVGAAGPFGSSLPPLSRPHISADVAPENPHTIPTMTVTPPSTGSGGGQYSTKKTGPASSASGHTTSSTPTSLSHTQIDQAPLPILMPSIFGPHHRTSTPATTTRSNASSSPSPRDNSSSLGGDAPANPLRVPSAPKETPFSTISALYNNAGLGGAILGPAERALAAGSSRRKRRPDLNDNLSTCATMGSDVEESLSGTGTLTTSLPWAFQPSTTTTVASEQSEFSDKLPSTPSRRPRSLPTAASAAARGRTNRAETLLANGSGRVRKPLEIEEIEKDFWDLRKEALGSSASRKGVYSETAKTDEAVDDGLEEEEQERENLIEEETGSAVLPHPEDIPDDSDVDIEISEPNLENMLREATAGAGANGKGSRPTPPAMGVRPTKGTSPTPTPAADLAAVNHNTHLNRSMNAWGERERLKREHQQQKQQGSAVSATAVSLGGGGRGGGYTPGMAGSKILSTMQALEALEADGAAKGDGASDDEQMSEINDILLEECLTMLLARRLDRRKKRLGLDK